MSTASPVPRRRPSAEYERSGCDWGGWDLSGDTPASCARTVDARRRAGRSPRYAVPAHRIGWHYAPHHDERPAMTQPEKPEIDFPSDPPPQDLQVTEIAEGDGPEAAAGHTVSV